MTKVECIFNLNSIEDAYLYLLDKFKNKKIFIFKKNNHSEVSEFLWKMQDRFFIHEQNIRSAKPLKKRFTISIIFFSFSFF